YDRLSEIDQGAVVENKRLGHLLQVAQLVQAERDNRCASGMPSRTNQGMAPRPKERKAGTHTQRELTLEQLNATVLCTARERPAAVGK
ncbi:transposase, partial [Caballeronia glebae]